MISLAKKFWPIVLIACAALVYVVAVQPFTQWRERVEAEYVNALETQQRLSESIARMSTEIDGIANDPDLPLAWLAPQMGQANAQVQAQLGQLAREAGISLRSTTPIGERDLPYAESIAFRLEGEGDLDQWQDLLRAIEFNNPPILIERGTMRRLVRPGPESEQPTLYAQLELFAPVMLEE